MKKIYQKPVMRVVGIELGDCILHTSDVNDGPGIDNEYADELD